MAGLISLLIFAALAVAFGVVIVLRSMGASNQGAELGDNSPWPDTAFVRPPGHRPPLGSPESLDTHASGRWADRELRREERRHRRRVD